MILNYTPHQVTVKPEDRTSRIFKTDGIARVKMHKENKLPDIDGMPVVETYSSGVVTGLPEKQEGINIIVSLQVYIAEEARDDLIICHGAVRDERNQIIYCKGFARPCIF